MISKQVTFDTVASALLKQGKRSVNDGESRCQFRAKDGSRCAVGHLIPDEMYDPRMEQQGNQNMAMEVVISLGHDGKLCNDLLDLHDMVSVSAWPQALKRLAELHKLDGFPPKDWSAWTERLDVLKDEAFPLYKEISSKLFNEYYSLSPEIKKMVQYKKQLYAKQVSFV